MKTLYILGINSSFHRVEEPLRERLYSFRASQEFCVLKWERKSRYCRWLKKLAVSELLDLKIVFFSRMRRGLH
jgi:hypothetical protein